MTRRSLLHLLAAPAVARGAPRRPNVVLFLADDLGSGDLSISGASDIRTPNIDGIGHSGVRFTQAYTNGPECSPTRTALLTGRYQHRFGGLECAIGLADVGRYDEAVWLQKRGELGLPAGEAALPLSFRSAGYDTGCFGKWHLGYPEKFWANRQGFDEFFGILGGNSDYFTHREENGRLVLYHNDRPAERRGYTTDLFAEAAIDWLKRRKNPFFLYVPFSAPHSPYQDPGGFDAKLGTAPVRDRDRAVYARMVERVDQRVGDILAQVRAMGREDDTIVLFLSDNGGTGAGRNGALRGSKSSLWEGGIRTPLLMRWPGRIPKGRSSRQVILTMDLAPTLLSAAGLSPAGGASFDGIDLMPVIDGDRPEMPRTVYWRSRRAANIRKAVRDGDWKYIDTNGEAELFHLAGDEFERTNLLSSEPERVRALKDKLAAWEREVRAPRLRDFRPEAA